MARDAYDWTAKAIARLEELWLSGMSARLIGEDLRTSNNSVISKAARIGLPARPSPIGVRGPKPRDRRPVVRPPPPPSSPAPVITSSRVCQWPLWATGTRPTHEYCGEAVAQGSWCPRHRKTVFGGRIWM